MLIIFASLVSAICLWPTSLPRFMLLGILITIASVQFRRNALLMKICLCTLFPVGLYTIVPVIGQYNRSTSVDLDQLLTMPDFSEILYSPDYDGFEWMAHTADYVEENGSCYGMNIVSAVLFMVPRSIFPLKYEASGAIVAEYAGSDFLNVSCPLPAEGFFAFSWAGVVCVGLLCGLFIPWLDRQLLRGKSIVFVVLAACILGQLCILLRGPMLGVANFVVVEIAWLYLIVFCSSVLRTFIRR